MLNLRLLFLNHNAQTTDFPLSLEITHAEGLFLFDQAGKKYLDLISGIGVSSIGHRHPKVIDAIKNQADRYLHLMVYGEYIQTPQTLLAAKLATLLPANLSSIYLVNSGSEAIEGAMKLTKRYTGRSEIIACKNSYHGSTHGALSIMGNETFKQAYRPLLPDIRFIDFGEIAEIEKISTKTAAVFIETIQGEAGIKIADKTYWKALRAKCTETGTLLVLDEIQCGIGRSGKFTAFEHYDIVPDILVLAKALGGGMPIGAFISSADIMNALKENPILGHITTFGGHPLNCAAALATLEVLESENLIESVIDKGNLFKTLLIHPEIIGVRGQGLMLAVQLKDFEFNKRVIDECIENGLIVDWFLHCDDSMRIAPPLTISTEEIQSACAIILAAIEKISNKN
jgi:acetylornithine/succinyldiaminopimelate/putrescine aminotransferase